MVKKAVIKLISSDHLHPIQQLMKQSESKQVNITNKNIGRSEKRKNGEGRNKKHLSFVTWSNVVKQD